MFPVWVLNLDRSVDRWSSLQKQAEQQSLKLKRWSATDGNAVGLDSIVGKTVSQHADFLGLRNAAAIAGLCHSSFSLWNHLLTIESDWFLILEDDVVLPADLGKLIEHCWKSLPSDAEAVLLGCDFWQRPTAHLDAQRFYESIQPHQLPFWRIVKRVGGAFAYAINKKGLTKLLQQVPFTQAVDCFPYNLECYLLSFHNQPYYCEGMAFYGVVHCSGAASTVQV